MKLLETRTNRQGRSQDFLIVQWLVIEVKALTFVTKNGGHRINIFHIVISSRFMFSGRIMEVIGIFFTMKFIIFIIKKKYQ